MCVCVWIGACVCYCQNPSEGLQKALDKLHLFWVEWKTDINAVKTRVMTFTSRMSLYDVFRFEN